MRTLFKERVKKSEESLRVTVVTKATCKWMNVMVGLKGCPKGSYLPRHLWNFLPI